MADEIIPIIPKAGDIFIHTGNIVNWNRLKLKLAQTPTQELSECISQTVTSWLETVDRAEQQYASHLDISNTKFIEDLDGEEREGLKITVKIFLSSPNADYVTQAVQRACSELGVSTIETVLVSLPDQHDNLESLQVAWRALETLIDDGVVFTIGAADLDKNKLENLYDWARVKPCINQVNLATCCVMPQDLVEFAKDHDIQLLTHNDPKEILTGKQLQTQLAETLTSRDSDFWECSWVVRYSVLIKCRGVIRSKGYMVRGARDIKRRN